MEKTEMLFIKKMTTPHCIILVEELFKKLRIHYATVAMGIVKMKYKISDELHKKLKIRLKKLGFELVSKDTALWVQTIIEIVNDKIYKADVTQLVPDLQVYIAIALGFKAENKSKYIANIFGSVMKVNLQDYIINVKIEYMEFLLRYKNYSLEEIRVMLNYCSIQHMSEQFFDHTGFTPGGYRKYYSIVKKLK